MRTLLLLRDATIVYLLVFLAAWQGLQVERTRQHRTGVSVWAFDTLTISP